MPREIALFGALVPTLLVQFLLGLLLVWMLDGLAARHGLYRHVWNPALVRLALFVCIFGGFGLLGLG
ncbi:MAG: DUF1656 domain-containing protein [Rhodanobacteraceae bacterium]|jgi:hypothetical protein|nr:DUF1656 domain-containing protein [Rhodanobacteraceae bacterium]